MKLASQISSSFFAAFSEKLAELAIEDFSKEANLDERESASFKELLKRRAHHETEARKVPSGTSMPADLHEKMIHDTERLKHFQEKKRNPNHKIPDWAHGTDKPPPKATFSSRHNPPSSTGSAGGPAAGHQRQSTWEQARDEWKRGWEKGRQEAQARRAASPKPHAANFSKALKRHALNGAIAAGVAGTAALGVAAHERMNKKKKPVKKAA